MARPVHADLPTTNYEILLFLYAAMGTSKVGRVSVSQGIDRPIDCVDKLLVLRGGLSELGLKLRLPIPMQRLRLHTRSTEVLAKGDLREYD